MTEHRPGGPASLPAVATSAAIALIASGAYGEAEAPAAPAEDAGLISLLDVAPPAYAQLKRMPKYYGDPNMNRETLDGPLLERQYLLGSVDGLRDRAAENGLILDFGVTQVVQGAASGDGDGGRYFGSADLWAALDTGRAGLWSGGLIVGHLEGNWGETVGGTGALLPINMDTTMPAAPSAFALSELYLVQGLPAGFSLTAGKVNFTGLADKSLFANDERNQFLYTGLNNNPILGAFVPYTSLGLALGKQFSEEFGLVFVTASNSTNALSPGFNDLKLDETTYGLAGNWTPTFGGLPANYNFLVGYTTTDFVNFNIDERHLIDVIEGNVPIPRKDGSPAFTLAGSQYVWVDATARRSDGLPVGVGLFARFGIAPEDRNLIDQFYSVGVGGTGGPFGRNDDNWGVGWSGTHFSSDFRRDAAVLGADVDSFEHAVEAYYNVALTPAVRTSFHVQYLDSAAPGVDDALVLAGRLQLDF